MVSARAKRGRIEPHERVLDDSLFNVRGLVENAILANLNKDNIVCIFYVRSCYGN
jgi:hypothetical protein